MNLAFYISGKILATQRGSFSRTIVNLAVISVAVSIVILTLSFSILSGFKQTITKKIYSLEGHIQLSRSEFYKKDFGTLPVSVNSNIYDFVPSIPGVKSINQFAVQRGVLHANSHVFGSMVKGYDKDYDYSEFEKNIIKGSFIQFNDSSYSRGIIISKFIADRLALDTTDELLYYFYQNGKFKPRKLFVQGIYRTHLEEFDQRIVFADLGLIRKLNNWNDTLTGGFEINTTLYSDDNSIQDDFLSGLIQLLPFGPQLFESVLPHKYTSIQDITQNIEDVAEYNLFATSIETKYIYLFDWLNLLEQQVDYFLYIIRFIVFINIISAMYIFIKERTNMIGTLKAMGAHNRQLNFIFWITGVRILLKGLLWGNLVGLGVCLLQMNFNLFPLDPESYYMDSVPVILSFWTLLKINLYMILSVMVFLTIPAMIINRITPIKSIKFN